MKVSLFNVQNYFGISSLQDFYDLFMQI